MLGLEPRTLSFFLSLAVLFRTYEKWCAHTCEEVSDHNGWQKVGTSAVDTVDNSIATEGPLQQCAIRVLILKRVRGASRKWLCMAGSLPTKPSSRPEGVSL